MFNPFFIQRYGGPEYFCDRQDEINRLVSIATNHRSVVMHSMRRLGKTGLIQHLQHILKAKYNYKTVYIDVLDSYSDESFVAQLVSACAQQLFDEQATMITKVGKFFNRYKPKFSFDSLTGNPSIELEIKTKTDVDLSLETIFKLLNESKQSIHIAIDEFQQIAQYKNPSKIDATLRKYLAQTKQVQVLFSGSQRHLLLDLFNNPKKPMFASADHMELHEIPYTEYSEFIIRMFKNNDRSIDERVVHQVLQWTRSHTFYTQSICNRLYAIQKEHIGEKDLILVQRQVMKEYEMTFLSYRNILSKNQYQVLKSIAKETQVRSVRAKDFSGKYGIASSTAQQSLDYLVDKELVYEKLDKEGSLYFVYDLFLARWLERVEH